jgi:uncharacterized protein
MGVAAEIQRELDVVVVGDHRLFDAHSHTGADIDGSERTSAEHLEELAAFDGRSVIFPFCVRGSYREENLRVIEEARESGGRLVPFARLDPKRERGPEAADALAAGARGFKFHPRAENFELSHPGFDSVLAVAAEARAPVLIHAGTGVGSFGPTLLELAERHRDCPLILAHAGISDLAWVWPRLPEYPNIYFDTAWLVPSDLLALFALVPPGRILFGSDAPYMDLDLLLAATLRCARFAGLSEEAIGLVVGGQLEALLGGGDGIEVESPLRESRAVDPARARVASLLAAAGGCLYGGGDPALSLELSALAAAGDSSPEGLRIRGLIDEARRGSDETLRAIVLALTLALTPETSVREAIPG